MTGKLRTALIFALALSLPGMPISAETPKASAKESADSRKVMREFAECVVDRNPDVAREFVLAVGKFLEAKKFQKLVDGKCLGFRGGKLWMSDSNYRGALADELVDTDFGTSFVLSVSNIPPLAWVEPTAPSLTDKTGKPLTAKGKELAKNLYDRSVIEYYFSQLGECIVRLDPEGSKALLVTKTESPEEAAIFTAISSSIVNCVKQGETIKLRRADLRNAMAVSYYRLASAQNGAGVTE